MSTDVRTGRSKDHRHRKNPASREAWMKAKRKNRPKQVFVIDEYLRPELPVGEHSPCVGHWEKVAA